MSTKSKLILAAQIGNCVHVAGGIHFLNLAAQEGYDTEFLGPAVSIDTIIQKVQQKKPDIVTLGYRLTPENVVPLIEELIEKSKILDVQPRWIFGGTRPVSEVVSQFHFFEKIYYSVEDIDETIAFLRGNHTEGETLSYEDSLLSRIQMKSPYPLLRHHFGLPSFSETVEGIQTIADANVLDIISLGPDQNTQEYFFSPEKRNPHMDGAGGVHIQTEADFMTLKAASQRGNYPLMRCYSGTADVLPFADVLHRTIHNAWCAVPLCWYNELDGRGVRSIETSIQEAQALMQWHGERNIPVEANEPHHWALRDAHDVIAVAMAYIAAYNAKKCGVKHYISQFMFNVPNTLSFSMDLAKALAQERLCNTLIDDSFSIIKQSRAGLPFLSGDLDIAKGQLAASTYLQMALRPDIIHVVGYSEAEHAATPEVVIESCKIVRGVIRSILHGNVSFAQDRVVTQRVDQLVSEAQYLISFIQEHYSHQSADPLADPMVLAQCIQIGILDAPHIVKNQKFRGCLETRVMDGQCVAYDSKTSQILTEEQRLSQVIANHMKNAI